MSAKFLIMIGMVVGSTIGGFLPELWGGGVFSFSSVILLLSVARLEYGRDIN